MSDDTRMADVSVETNYMICLLASNFFNTQAIKFVILAFRAVLQLKNLIIVHL